MDDTTTTNLVARIPIAKLSPAIGLPSASINVVVALIWPYSSVAKTITFLLAEPDFSLRQEGGQVRVQFSGSSGKAVAESGIGIGDVIVLHLDGVDWIPKDPTARIPGRSIEWELKYSERLRLEFSSEGSQESKKINIDHPTPAVAVELSPEEPTVASPPAETPEVSETATLVPRSRKLSEVEAEDPEEWKSPAFIKRARTSFGSLYGSSDIFAEGTGSSRKKSRLGWRYTSRSPSLTPSVEAQGSEDEVPADVPSIPDMTDEGCQTHENEEGLSEIPQHITAEPINAASSSFAARTLSSNEANRDSMTQTQPKQMSSKEDINVDAWTSVENQSCDQALNPISQQPLIEPLLALGQDVTPCISSRPTADESEIDVAVDEAIPDENPDIRNGFTTDSQPPPISDVQYLVHCGEWAGNMSNNDNPPPEVTFSPLQPFEYPSPTQSPTYQALQSLEASYQAGLYPQLEEKSELYTEGADLIDMDHDNGKRPRAFSNSTHKSHHSSARQTPNVQQPQGSVPRSQDSPVPDITGDLDEGVNADGHEDAARAENSNDHSASDRSVGDKDDDMIPREFQESGFAPEIREGHFYKSDEKQNYDTDTQLQDYESGYDEEEEEDKEDEDEEEEDEDDEDEEEEDEDEEDEDQEDQEEYEYKQHPRIDQSAFPGSDEEEDPSSRNGGTLDPQEEPVIIDLLSSPEDYDPSAELALATFDSPPKIRAVTPQSIPLVHEAPSPEEYDPSAELALANFDSPPRNPIITLQQVPCVHEASSPEEHDPSAELALTNFDSPAEEGLKNGISEGHDASAELALASLHSPLTKRLDASSPPAPSPGPANPSSLKRPLRTERGEYTVLNTLRIRLNQKRDVLAIATTPSTTPQQAAKAPRHWMTAFHLTDASVSAGLVTRVAVFRPRADALPAVRPGDGVLLRNFRVQSAPRARFALRSDADSSWAVARAADGRVEARGPPLEAGPEEFAHLARLRAWFAGMAAAQREALDRAHRAAPGEGHGRPGGK